MLDVDKIWRDPCMGAIRDELSLSAQRLFEALVPYAINGKKCPSAKEMEASHGISHHVSKRLYNELVRVGVIDAHRYSALGGQSKQIEILVGRHAGKKTARPNGGEFLPVQSYLNAGWESRLVKHYPIKPSFTPDEMVVHGKRHCLHCGAEVGEIDTYCSEQCRHDAIKYDYATKAQVDARLKRLAEPKPKGCATVEEWLAAGGTIYSEPGFTSHRDAESFGRADQRQAACPIDATPSISL